MLAEQQPTIVSICAGPLDREAMVDAALQSGATRILCEKPAALAIQSALSTDAACARADARAFVNHQRRYGAPFLAFRRAVRGGAIGDLQSIEIKQPFAGLIDFGSHLRDAALFALASIARGVVAAHKRSRR